MSATYICRECGEDVPLGMGCCGFRERVGFEDSNPRHMSFTPLDVGFDPRVHDMAVALPEDVEAVRFVDDEGEVRFRRGKAADLAEVLRAAGYRVEVTS
ncbi:MAG: hypothetical protein WDO69_05640 [Pseudomonadota bacterium]